METKVTHSDSKDAWNVVGTIPGCKYKIARVPYIRTGDSAGDSRNIMEALEHAEFISDCFNNSSIIKKTIYGKNKNR